MINEINLSNEWHESWCEVNVTKHEVLKQLINRIAMWYATWASYNAIIHQKL
jgi:hypothetical protein